MDKTGRGLEEKRLKARFPNSEMNYKNESCVGAACLRLSSISAILQVPVLACAAIPSFFNPCVLQMLCFPAQVGLYGCIPCMQ